MDTSIVSRSGVHVTVRVDCQDLVDRGGMSPRAGLARTAAAVAWTVASEVALLVLGVSLVALGWAAGVLAAPLQLAGRTALGHSRLLGGG